MNIVFATLDTCDTAEDLVVVIDVVRAFTTAAYAFASGASQILLVGTVEEALALRAANPGARGIGEVGGFAPAGFDFGNSPREMLAANIAGQLLIQRTSMGTRGVVRSRAASVLLAASFVCAGATVRYIREASPGTVTFVITGRHGELGGDEDQACAEYMVALLHDEQPDAAPYLERVLIAIDGIAQRRPTLHEMLVADAPYCTALDRFPFVMRVDRSSDLHVMSQVFPANAPFC